MSTPIGKPRVVDIVRKILARPDNNSKLPLLDRRWRNVDRRGEISRSWIQDVNPHLEHALGVLG